ncbi:hypothetical protein [uncultured Methanobrevibacter sp.]|uniref:hypothetical protein n=1 Tax=uncultured Methanobrevibacter sp. TaxID=253161 RepID=UPI0025ECFD81|nr:hypothetical protein [uncultured Methanobrevibacter sp.]
MCSLPIKYRALKPLMLIEQGCYSLSELINKHVQKLNPGTGSNILFLNFDKAIIVKSNKYLMDFVDGWFFKQ